MQLTTEEISSILSTIHKHISQQNPNANLTTESFSTRYINIKHWFHNEFENEILGIFYSQSEWPKNQIRDYYSTTSILENDKNQFRTVKKVTFKSQRRSIH